MWYNYWGRATWGSVQFCKVYRADYPIFPLLAKTTVLKPAGCAIMLSLVEPTGLTGKIGVAPASGQTEDM
jgi:hypothetical protein